MSRSLNITTTENTLTVYNVTSSDVGTYTCNSSNIIGSVTSSRILTVTSKFSCSMYLINNVAMYVELLTGFQPGTFTRMISVYSFYKSYMVQLTAKLTLECRDLCTSTDFFGPCIKTHV